MEAENEEEGYTLTSFEPLLPEEEKSGLRKFIEGFKSRKFVTPKAISHDSQTSLENSTKNDTHVSYISTDVKRKEQLPKESPVTQRRYSKKEESQVNGQNGQVGQLQHLGQGRTRASLRSRTPSSVLRRLSQLVLLEKSNLQVKKEFCVWKWGQGGGLVSYILLNMILPQLPWVTQAVSSLGW